MVELALRWDSFTSIVVSVLTVLVDNFVKVRTGLCSHEFLKMDFSKIEVLGGICTTWEHFSFRQFPCCS